MQKIKSKIFIPIGSFYPDQTNGPSFSLYWLSRCLVDEQYKVTVYTTHLGMSIEKKNHKKIVESSYGEVHYFKTLSIKFPLRLMINSFFQIRKNDCIIITSLFYPLSVFLFFTSLFFSKKFILSPRGELYENALKSKSVLLKRVYLRLIKIILKLRSRNYIFHATSDEEVKTIRTIFGESITIALIPNYIYFEPTSINNHTRSHLLFLGRIHPDKSLFKLLKGYKIYIDSTPNSKLRLILTGDPTSRYGKDLINFIKLNDLIDRVEFVGYVSGQKKEILISESLCTVLISNSENFGNSILESLCLGTPVITSTGTPWKEVENRNCGFWIKNDPDIIAKKIELLDNLSDNDYRIMCENAKRFSFDEFSIQNHKSKWIEIFEN